MALSKRGPGKSARRHGVQSIEVGWQLLDALANGRGPVSLRDLSADAGMSASKARRYLVSLLRCGLVEQDRATGRYDLGAMALRLGLCALNRRHVMRIATDALINLNQEVDKTVMLSIWGERGPTVVAWYDSSEILICNLNVGSILPLLRSATGRVFLAYLPRSMTRSFVDRELEGTIAQLQTSRIKTKQDVEHMIAETRRHRIGITYEELVPGLSAVAAPIFDHEGRIVAAMAMLGLPGSIETVAPNTPAHALQRTADQVSRRLGFQACEPSETFAEWLDARAARHDAKQDLQSTSPTLMGAPSSSKRSRKSGAAGA